MDKHPKRTHYPTYDVMSEKNEWDPVTQQVLFTRIHPSESSILTPDMKRTLQALAKTLFPSHLGEQTLSLTMVLDQRLTAKKLKAFPKGANFSKELIILKGLTFMEQEAITEHGKTFYLLDEKTRNELVRKWRSSDGDPSIWAEVHSDLFFSTVSAEIVKIIYSDPAIWSDIGYGGPAFPRGYYAFGPHQFDEWEAKPHGENLI
ncbi:gluconate 2-dehydrogenase subunit 3 family protein [Pontibacillus sp. ALD_SL1]|uniref:gluconate 2-dehydrogenase subunit 3 family protein n=1 Tax=Pontibacillus sp. ALD_SL1 TaxID=2777185 RepID=UPI001A96D0F8|nr:gluconate 2-dehydrogenase subunit 3 family protein [Pontibacillus sp. ALD_SL1]QST00620.1 gluconate 2-dehydrogenase subunit 3 family protein [Pontibacillus sp. ALD_SL1]